jgi:hypothetical protein
MAEGPDASVKQGLFRWPWLAGTPLLAPCAPAHIGALTAPSL